MRVHLQWALLNIPVVQVATVPPVQVTSAHAVPPLAHTPKALGLVDTHLPPHLTYPAGEGWPNISHSCGEIPCPSPTHSPRPLLLPAQRAGIGRDTRVLFGAEHLGVKKG